MVMEASAKDATELQSRAKVESVHKDPQFHIVVSLAISLRTVSTRMLCTINVTKSDMLKLFGRKN